MGLLLQPNEAAEHVGCGFALAVGCGDGVGAHRRFSTALEPNVWFHVLTAIETEDGGQNDREPIWHNHRARSALRRIMVEPGCVVTGGPTRANPHLAPASRASVEALYAGRGWSGRSSTANC